MSRTFLVHMYCCKKKKQCERRRRMEIIGFTRVFRLDPPEQKYLDPPLKFLSKDDKTLKRLWLTKWPATTATECFSTISKISELSQMYFVLLTHQSTYGRTTLPSASS